MFFILSKILYFIVNPATWIIALLFLAIIFKRKNIKTALLICAALMYFVFTNNAIVNSALKMWEVPSLPADSIKLKYKYAVVLGGMAWKDTASGKLIIERSVDRILLAIQLYHAKKIDKILITGGSASIINQNMKEAPWIKEFCTVMGVDSADINIESDSKNTYENAIYSRKFIGITSEKILLITSAFHMRRSASIFKKAGYNFDYLATDPFVKTKLYFDDYIMPKSEALVKWTFLIKEVVGYIVYKILGYN